MKRVFLTVASAALLAIGAGAVQAQPPGHAKAKGKVSAGAHGPNVHASDRARDVRRMLDAEESPGYAYGRDDTRVRGGPRARGGDRGPNANASARAHEVHRLLEAGENPGHHYGQTKSRAGAKAKANARGDVRGKARVKANARPKAKTR